MVYQTPFHQSLLLFLSPFVVVNLSSAMSSSSSMSSMVARSIKHIQPTVLHTMKPGFTSRSLRVDYAMLMDPFVMLDNFWMARAIFPPHPHAGFLVVTYI
jgi:hypothetical protein